MFEKIISKFINKPQDQREDASPSSQDDIHTLVLNFLIAEYSARYKDERGVHIETILSNLGALAGFGCQMAIREGLIKTGQITEQDAFITVETTDKQKYYFGDFLNEPLLSTKEGRISVWTLVGGAAQSLGSPLPDINEIVGYYAGTVGSDAFFASRLPEKHRPKQLPIEALGYWSATRTMQIMYKVDTLFWGWTYAMAAQRLILQAKDIIDPGMAARIVMEAAIPMSKMDPDRVKGAYLPNT